MALNRWPASLVLACVALALALGSPVRAEEEPDAVTDGPAPVRSEWTGLSAAPLARHEGSVALFADSRFGVGHDVQLGTHVAGLLAPNVSVLYRFVHRGRLSVAARAGLAYPYPLLRLLTGEGTGALLPVDRDPAQGLMIDLAARVSVQAGARQWFTFESALVLAPRSSRPDTTLLDFPFLYPRFAALEAPVVARFRGTGEGIVAGPIRWVIGLEYWVLPVTARGFAFEQRAGLAWVARRRVTLELGARGSVARYPAGRAGQVTPYFDVAVLW